jgi:hypothetical protein
VAGGFFIAEKAIDAHLESKAQTQAAQAAETQRQAELKARVDWSIDDLRRRIDDPGAAWNRGPEVPYAREASVNASVKPTPCR